MYHALLFFHVLGAFALVAGTVAMAPFALGVGAAALERVDAARLARIGTILSGVGAGLTIVLGLWLVDNRGYELVRFWIIGALVLWAAAGYCNGQVSAAAGHVRKGEEAKAVRWLWVADALASALIIALMLWKPGH